MKFSHILFTVTWSLGLLSCSTQTSTPELSKREMGILGRAEYENERLKDPVTGKIPEGIQMRELTFASSLPKSVARKNGESDQKYIPIGPRNVGGRTRAISFHETIPNVILAGGVSGGMWRSSDLGQTWKRATNYEDQSAVSCVVQDTRPGKTNVFYYGSGESSGNSASKSFSAMFYGSGMYKSTDDGKTWAHLTSTTTPTQKRGDWSYIYNIAMDPSNLTEDEIYAATSKGIRRSIDGGQSWTLVLGNSGNAEWTNVVVTTSGICYAQFSSDASQSGFFRSSNGINWVNISPNDIPGTHERTLMAVSPSNENNVYFYTFTPGENSRDVSFWKYTYLNGDGSGSGGVWDNRTNGLPSATSNYYRRINTQSNYCMSLGVSPNNDNMVYLGGTNLYRSSNGFNSTSGTRILGGYTADGYSNFDWNSDNQHPDQQSLAFNPHNTNQLLASTDGGLHLTDAPETSKVIWTSLNNGYQTTQFYGLGIDHLEENEIVLSGYQDNGSWMTFSADTNTDWFYTNGGDGAYCAKEGGEDNYYFSSQNGSLRRMKISANGSASSVRSIRPSNTDEYDYLFNHPFILDPADNNKMYLPVNGNLWRNDDLSGYDQWQENWTNIATVPGTITALGASTNNPGTVYVGLNNKNIYKIVDNGTNQAVVTDVTSGIDNGGYTSNIEVDPNNSDNVLVVYSNYNVKSMWSTTDGGSTWTNIEGNLKGDSDPGVPPSHSYIGNGPSFRWAKFIHTENGSSVLLGTSVGLFATNLLDGENTVWVQQASDIIGNVVIEQIDYRESDGFCVIGTHGAGAYKTYFNNNWDLVSVKTIESEQIKIQLFPNPTQSTAQLTFINEGNENVRVNVLNAAGKVVEIKNIHTISGENSLNIDLSPYAEGMYFITIITKDGSYTKSVLKQ